MLVVTEAALVNAKPRSHYISAKPQEQNQITFLSLGEALNIHIMYAGKLFNPS